MLGPQQREVTHKSVPRLLNTCIDDGYRGKGVSVQLSNYVKGFCSIKAQENVEHAKIELTMRCYSMQPFSSPKRYLVDELDRGTLTEQC